MAARRKTRKRRVPLPPWVLLGGGLAAGVAGALLYDAVQQMDWKMPLDRFAIGDESVRDLPSLDFEFYTLLPDQEFVVAAPAPKLDVPTPATPPEKTSSTAPTSSGAYYLQVGSFLRLSAADSMKAKVTLLGTHASIQEVRRGDDTLYRVRAGPYEDVAQVSEVQAQLQKHQINSLLVRAKP